MNKGGFVQNIVQPVTPRIVCAVGLARNPRKAPNVSKELRRVAMRAFIYLLHNRLFSPDVQREMMAQMIRLNKWIWGPLWTPIGGATKGDTLENDLLKLLFNATAIANVADNAASSPNTNVYYALHTADPGEAGSQTTSETTYTSYARVAVARTSGGHTVTANSVSPVAQVSFPAGTGGSGTVTHFSAGKSSSGAGVLWYSGTVTPNIVTGNGVTPKLETTTAITED